MMCALRPIGVLVLLVVLTLPIGVTPAADDPQSLLIEARSALECGDVEGAEFDIQAIRSLLQSNPFWDPDRSFADRLLPELEARAARMKRAIGRLEALPEIVNENTVPGSSGSPDDLADYLARGRTLIQRIQANIDQIAASLPEGEERGALLQSRSYERAAHLASTEVFSKMTEILQERVTELAEGDERIRALKTRLEALKRETMTFSVEREGLQSELAAAQERHRANQRWLMEFIGYDPADLEDHIPADLGELGMALAHRIRDRLTEVRALEQQTLLDKALLLEQIQRLRLANAVIVTDGSRDLNGRIDALAAAVEKVPLAGPEVLDPSMGWLACCLSVCRQ